MINTATDQSQIKLNQSQFSRKRQYSSYFSMGIKCKLKKSQREKLKYKIQLDNGLLQW